MHNYIIYNNSTHYNRRINITYPAEHKKHNKNNTLKIERKINILSEVHLVKVCLLESARALF